MDQKKLDELMATERREYYREWRAKNKDKVRKHNETYWRKRAERRVKEKEATQ